MQRIEISSQENEPLCKLWYVLSNDPLKQTEVDSHTVWEPWSHVILKATASSQSYDLRLRS